MADPDFFKENTLIPTPLNDDAIIPPMAEKRHMPGVPPSRIPRFVKTFSPSPQPPQMKKLMARDQHVHKQPALPVERADLVSNEFENKEKVPGTKFFVPQGYNLKKELASIRRRKRK